MKNLKHGVKSIVFGTIFAVALGVFALAGAVSASSMAETLQPVSTITYDEEVVINNTIRANSAYIGSTAAGVGGVTFFNGTIVNNSVDANGASTIPVTFGDDVRIDGEIYRTEVGGDDPLKLADTIRPQTTATYDLGTTTNEFQDAYFSGTVNTAALSTGTLALTGALTGTTATLTGALTGTTATFSGDVTAVTDVSVNGDIIQDIASDGAVKAMVEIDGNSASCLVKSWTFNKTTPTCVRSGAGTYTLTFASSIDVDTRYYSATSVVEADSRIVSAVAVDNVVRFYVYDENGGANDTDVMFVVY